MQCTQGFAPPSFSWLLILPTLESISKWRPAFLFPLWLAFLPNSLISMKGADQPWNVVRAIPVSAYSPPWYYFRLLSSTFPFWLVSTFILILPSLPVSLLPSSYLNHRTSSRRSQSHYQIKCRRSKWVQWIAHSKSSQTVMQLWAAQRNNHGCYQEHMVVT